MKHIIVSLVMMFMTGNLTMAMEAPASSAAQALTHYAVLGVSATASLDEIKSAYQKKIIVWHPDKWQRRGEQPVSDAEKIHASQQFALVMQAWDILSNPQEKARYDAEAFKKESECKKDEQKKAAQTAFLSALRRRDYRQLSKLVKILSSDELSELCQNNQEIQAFFSPVDISIIETLFSSNCIIKDCMVNEYKSNGIVFNRYK